MWQNEGCDKGGERAETLAATVRVPRRTLKKRERNKTQSDGKSSEREAKHREQGGKRFQKTLKTRQRASQRVLMTRSWKPGVGVQIVESRGEAEGKA